MGATMSDTPLAFLAERGFTLDFHLDDGVTWADLRSIRDPGFRISRYSGARDPHAAAVRAVARWREEQPG